MTSTARIRCINKREHKNPHERITHVGGMNSDGSRWKQTEDKTIQEIEDKSWAYYTDEGGKRADVIVATHNLRKYLKTTADGYAPDNLLSLPECP
jgi:hypothetical protein